MKVTVRYTETTLKAAVAAYVKQVYLKRMIFTTILAVALVAYALTGAPSWLQAFIFVTVILIPSVLVLGYLARVKHSLKVLEMLDDGQVAFSIEDDGLGTSSALGESRMKWTIFTEIWDTPKSWLLMYTNHQFITLPKDQVSEEFMAELRNRIAR